MRLAQLGKGILAAAVLTACDTPTDTGLGAAETDASSARDGGQTGAPSTHSSSGSSSTSISHSVSTTGTPAASELPSSAASSLSTQAPTASSALSDSGTPSVNPTRDALGPSLTAEAGAEPSELDAATPLDGSVASGVLQDPTHPGAELEDYLTWPFDAEEAQRRQSETASALGIPVEAVLPLGDGVMMEFVLVPAGYVQVGSPASVDGFEGDEAQRFVTIPRPFYFGKYQLTRGEYRALMGSDAPGEGTDRQPAVLVYNDARDQVLPQLQLALPSGWNARLPAEDEWEYAARAGTSTLWYTGDLEEDLAAIAWYGGNSGGQLHEVGQLLPNPWGLYDMIGNAWHWIFRLDLPYGDQDPNGLHLVRGCDLHGPAFGNGCRTSQRSITDAPEGYRFVLDVPE